MDTFRIFLSSPGDVAEERLIARRVIDRLRGEFAGRIHIEPIFWEHEPLVASASFQDQLPHPADADAAICVLWSRLGTRLPSTFRKQDGSAYSSGTEFEFEDALSGLRRHGRPSLLVYRKTEPPLLDAENDVQSLERLQQKQALDSFVRRWFHDEADGTLRAAFHPFADIAQFEELIEIHLRKLIARAYPEAVGAERTELATWRHASPFRGLEAFGFEHAPIFFGRTTAIGEMIAALRRQDAANHPFLLVIGASGSGKSSVVQSGLLPILMQPGVIEGVANWQRVELRPRDRRDDLEALLIDVLAASTGLSAISTSELLPGLEASATTDTRIVLVVDQLEEVFSDERIGFDERERFFARLARLTATRAIWTIATLRSDFYPRCVEHADLVALKSGNGQYDLLPPTPAEIGQVIRLPAAAAGLRFETSVDGGERLDEVLRDEAARSPEALPLLEFALEELYKRRASDGTLTFAAYNDIGGVEGALAKRAEDVFLGLSPSTQECLPRALRKLIAATTSGASTFSRRSAALDEFPAGPQRDLVRALIDARLCVSELGTDAHPVVSIAHEALLRHWPRVRTWLEANRDMLRAHGRLTVFAERWAQEGRRPDLLLASGRPLEEALSVVQAGIDIAPLERALIDASRARARRAKGLRVAAVASLATLAVAASVAAIIATSQRQRAETEASTSRETMNFMVGLFTVADPTETRANAITVREILDRGASDVKRQLRDRPQVRSNLMTAMGRAYTGLGLSGPARELLADALREREQSVGASARSTTETRSALATAEFWDGRYDDAQRQYERALESARALAPEGDALVASILAGRGENLSQLGRDADAEASYREALAINTRLYGSDSVEAAEAAQGLAKVLNYTARYEEAERLTLRSVEIRRRELGDTHWKVADSLNELGAVYYRMGRFDEAAGALKECLTISEAWAGADHTETSLVAGNIGRILLIDGKLDEAEPYLQRRVATVRRVSPADDSYLVHPLNSLAMIHLARGDYIAAEKELVEAVHIAELRKYPELDQVLTNMADLYARTGRAGDALLLLDRARVLLQERYPKDNMPEEAWRHALQDSVRASALSSEKQYAEAETLLLASLPVIQQRFGAARFYTKDLKQRLVRLYTDWGKPKMAVRYAN